MSGGKDGGVGAGVGPRRRRCLVGCLLSWWYEEIRADGWASGWWGVDGAAQGGTLCPLGMASLDNKATGRMGMRAAVYYMVTTVIAVFIGILMVTIIHPGKGSKEGLHREGRIETIPTADAFMDLVR